MSGLTKRKAPAEPTLRVELRVVQSPDDGSLDFGAGLAVG